MNSNQYATQPTLKELLLDPLVDTELRRAWLESEPDTPEVEFGKKGSRKREQGGWIVWNPKTGFVRFIRVPSVSRDSIEIGNSNRPVEDDSQVVVAWFHTHPNTMGEGYDPRHSWSDVIFTRMEARVPCILESHTGRTVIPC